MCNAYNLRQRGNKGGANLDEVASVSELINAEIAKLPSPLIRRTGRGVVVTGISGELTATNMRWGFEHPRYREVNNTRATSLKSPFWAESLEKRRCLVPMSSFYEWAESASKSAPRQAYEFRRPDDDWMWVAGIYQPSEAHGWTYSTITTEPSPVVVAVHDRMLAVLDWERALEFLHGEFVPREPYGGQILAAPVPSPLKSSPKQRDLF